MAEKSSMMKTWLDDIKQQMEMSFEQLTETAEDGKLFRTVSQQSATVQAKLQINSLIP